MRILTAAAMVTRITPIRPTIELVTDVRRTVLTRTLLQTILSAIQHFIPLPSASTITIRVVGDKQMQKLNQRYRSVPEVTDVLSFGYNQAAADIVLCYPQAKRQAQAKQQTLRYECAWLVIHGILHWLGYDHETAADAKVMRPLEQAMLHYGQF